MSHEWTFERVCGAGWLVLWLLTVALILSSCTMYVSVLQNKAVDATLSVKYRSDNRAAEGVAGALAEGAVKGAKP
jgi:hypothetical protein